MKNITAITGPLLALGFWLLGAQPGQCFYNQGGCAPISTPVPDGAASGATPTQHEYGPFGEVIWATAHMARANPFRFSTKYQDDETDLLYFGYRYYNASTGRWICRDPLGDHAFFASYIAGKSKSERASLRSASTAPGYIYIANEPLATIDSVGLDRSLVIAPVHVYVIIDKWDEKCCRVGHIKIDFGPANAWYEALALTGVTVPGRVNIDPSSGGTMSPFHRSTKCADDKEALRAVQLQQLLSPDYNISGELPNYNCFTFALTAFFY